MTDDRMESTPRDEFDDRLARYLRWEARQVDVAPAISEVAVRIAGGTVRRSWPGNPAIAWAAIAMALVIVGTAVLFSGRPENPVVVAPSSSPGLASELPGPCGAGLVALQAAVGAVPPPAFAADIRVPVGGRLALALEEGPSAGTILVAGPEGSTPASWPRSPARPRATGASRSSRGPWTGASSSSGPGRRHAHRRRPQLRQPLDGRDGWLLRRPRSPTTAPTWSPRVSAFAPVGGALAYVQDGAVHALPRGWRHSHHPLPGLQPERPAGPALGFRCLADPARL